MKKQIHHIKTNKGQIGVNTAFLAGDILHFKSNLDASRDSETTMSGEISRWHIVPIVSIFESFYKELFAKYIDSSHVYLDRVHKLGIGEKNVSVENMVSLTKKTFTTGDIISYALNYNSFNSIRNAYEIICQCDYVEKISGYSFGERDVVEVQRLKNNVKKVISDVSFMFEMRHCLVHEYPATNVILSLDRTSEILDSSWLLLMATDRMMWLDLGLKNPFSVDFTSSPPQTPTTPSDAHPTPTLNQQS